MLIYNKHMSIGANIKKRRYELNMSQQDLADALGYKTRSTIAKIESEKNSLSYKKIQEFALVLDTTVEFLIGTTNDTSINNVNTFANTKNRNVCIILAGGKSTRNRQNVPNQFIDVNGKPIIIYSMEAYQSHPLITDIYVVCLKGWEKILTSYIKKYNISKFRDIISGGPTGIESAKNGFDYIRKYLKKEDIVIFQESTRPLVTNEMISNIIKNASTNDYSIMCEQMNDFLQFTTYDGVIKYVDRKNIISLQSPEAYKYRILNSAFMKKSNKETCVAMFMYNNGYKLKLIDNYGINQKIIRQSDIETLKYIIK